MMSRREVLRAIWEGDLQKLDAMVNQGVNIREVTEKEKWNYLHNSLLAVAMPPSRELISRLIELGVDVNAIDSYGNTPIHYAAQLNRPELLGLLIEAGANVNIVNLDGVSPLRQLLAERPYNKECFRLLLDAGADRHQKVGGGVSVKELASSVASDDPELLALFER